MDPLAARDMPDDYGWMPGSSRFPMADLGELAARLGSLVTYDRRGEVIWMDGFAAGLAPYTVSLSGVGASCELGSIFTGSSGYNARLTRGLAYNSYAILNHTLTPLIVDKLGLEINFVAESSFETLNFGFYDYRGAEVTAYGIGITGLPYRLFYRDIADAPVVFASVPNPTDAYGVSHTIKLVVDRANNSYLRVLYDDNAYDLRDIPAYTYALASTRAIQLDCAIVSDGAATRRMLVNKIIMTSNEP